MTEYQIRSDRDSTARRVAPPIVHEVLGSTGDGLDQQTRQSMGARFDTDFSRVRVHTDGRSARSADQLGASAYTVGDEVVFAKDAYRPDTSDGRRLIAHELAHVVQQRSGAGRNGALPVGSPGDAAEQSADRAADAAVTGRPVGPLAGVGAPTLRRKPASRLDRGAAGEQDMGFVGYAQESGWIILDGPSGAAGHRANDSGFDAVAARVEGGTVRIDLVDNKSYKAAGNASGSSALTTNLGTNLDRLIAWLSQQPDGSIPHLDDIKDALNAARAAVRAGQPLPDNVRLVLTNAGGRTTGVTDKLGKKGVRFRDLSALRGAPEANGPGTEPDSPPPSPAPAPAEPASAMEPAAGTGAASGDAVGVPDAPITTPSSRFRAGAAFAGLYLGIPAAGFGLSLLVGKVESDRTKRALQQATPRLEAEARTRLAARYPEYLAMQLADPDAPIYASVTIDTEIVENMDAVEKVPAVINRMFAVDSVGFVRSDRTKPDLRISVDGSMKYTHNLDTTVTLMPALDFDRLIDRASVFDLLTPAVLTRLRTYVLTKLAESGASGDVGSGAAGSPYWRNKLEIVDALLGG